MKCAHVTNTVANSPNHRTSTSGEKNAKYYSSAYTSNISNGLGKTEATKDGTAVPQMYIESTVINSMWEDGK
jgi:hypothetical protein